MKEKYLDLMEQVVGVYTRDRILSYIEEIEKEGITEHGFPRLTSDIGVLIAHGKRRDLLPLFLRMMDLCCKEMPLAKGRNRNAGNDFSIREIVLCLLAVEKSGVVSEEQICTWRQAITGFQAEECYSVIAKEEGVRVGNWAAFGAASEQARIYAGVGGDAAFIEKQVASQMLSFDENGMYRDPNEPMVYDVTTRLQLSVLLALGYRGRHYAELDRLLRLGGECSLLMQSVTGEIPFGGRSAQFLHNEACLAAVCEYEAVRRKEQGDLEKAGMFKSAARLATEAILRYLRPPYRHIKNCYPQDATFGCEGYGYFNKYMVTVASFLYLACFFADDTIKEVPCPAETGGYVFRTGAHFHKTILSAGGYCVEYETLADTNYDATGIGRIHHGTAPSALALSVPFAKEPKYDIGEPNSSLLSLCCGLDGRYPYEGAVYTEKHRYTSKEKAEIAFLLELEEGKMLEETCTVSSSGVHLQYRGSGALTLKIPVFLSDGARDTVISPEKAGVSVGYEGYLCKYQANGAWRNTAQEYRNRNGRYLLFEVAADDALDLQISIEKIEQK